MRRLWTPPRYTLLTLGLTVGIGLLPGCGFDADTDVDAAATGVEQWPAGAFQQALAPRDFTFPADHAPHPGFRDEWWYVTGNLWDDDRNRYGFQLTLFRRALQPPDSAAAPDAASDPDQSTPDTREGDDSARRQAYMGHFAITDVGGGHFHYSERFGRSLAGIAGSGHAPPRAWLDDWRLEWRQDHWRLSARHGLWALDLRLAPGYPPILQGDAGFSRKNAQAGNASFYYSQPRLQASGRLERPAADDCPPPHTHSTLPNPAPNPILCSSHSLRVDGLAWLDREWGSSQLAPEQQGWDWFALQLDDGRALMIYQLRDRDGRADPYSAGSLIAADGRKRALGHPDFVLTPLDYWQHPDGARIPVQWRVQIADEEIDWQVTAVQPAQYLEGLFPYWEGAVDVTAGGEAVGVGYLEMTGYGRTD